jgi:cohesin loading factor subunit SCC2
LIDSSLGNLRIISVFISINTAIVHAYEDYLIFVFSLFVFFLVNCECACLQDFEGQQIVRCTANILEVIVPLMEHPSEPFLAQLEEDVVKLIMRQSKPVVISAVQCLASIVNRVTRNYRLVKDCLGQYLRFMERYQTIHVTNPDDPRLEKSNPPFRRSLFVVGLFMQFFDFRDQTVRCGLEV